MEKRNSGKKIANNKFSFENFIRFFVGLEILLVFLYTRYFTSFSIYGNRVWLLIAAITILAIGSLILSWKLERNWISLFTGTSLPVLTNEAVCLWKYSSVIQAILLIGIVSALALGVICGIKKTRNINRRSVKCEVFIVKASRASRVLGCLVLLCVCILGKSLIALQYTVSYNDIDYSVSSDYNDIEDYSNSLAANIATISKIDPEGGWGALSVDEKVDVLQTIIRVECRYLGMKDCAPSLQLAYLEEGLLGQYDYQKDLITLSYNFVVDSGANGYAIVQVLCHEVYHRYQRYLVNLLEVLDCSSETEKYTSLLIFENAETYEDEMSNYFSPVDDSPISYYLYSSQELERDAEKYGNIGSSINRIHS